MSYSVSHVGGLAVMWSRQDTRTVEAALRRLDDRLFLDPEYEPHGPHGPYVFMTVKYHLGSGRPPSMVCEWRDSYGPKPLSLGLVEQVKRQEGVMASAFREALAANERIRQDAVKAVGDGAFDVVRDGGLSAAGKRSVNLPRSQSLRMARDKARARGEKV